MQNITFEYNSIIIIESLRAEDKKTGEDLSNALKEKFPDHTGIQYLTVTSKNDFIALMDEIKMLMIMHDKFRPIIDIETHGGEKIIEFADASNMKWADLMDITREINRILNNELVLFLACCHGYHYIKSTSVKKYSPCGYLFSPPKEIYDVVIKKATIEFFNEIISGGDLDNAAELVKQNGIHCFKSEEFFLNALTNYLINDLDNSNILKTDEVRYAAISSISDVFLGDANTIYMKHVMNCFNSHIAERSI